MSITKEWDWSKNTDNQWLIPCVESAYLAENWHSKGFAKFLDLGCGLGRHSIYMAMHGFDVTSVDLSDYGVNHLKQWAAKENLNIKTDVCNMLALPFEDNTFDSIMAYNVIYHTDKKGFIDALDEIKRVLKPNGELFITLISKKTYSFQNAENYMRIDENTLLRNEHGTETDVPHYYFDIEDIKLHFADWSFVITPKEWCEYDLENPAMYNSHWTMAVKPR